MAFLYFYSNYDALLRSNSKSLRIYLIPKIPRYLSFYVRAQNSLISMLRPCIFIPNYLNGHPESSLIPKYQRSF